MVEKRIKSILGIDKFPISEMDKIVFYILCIDNTPTHDIEKISFLLYYTRVIHKINNLTHFTSNINS